jgi:hypothetical protein
MPKKKGNGKKKGKGKSGAGAGTVAAVADVDVWETAKDSETQQNAKMERHKMVEDAKHVPIMSVAEVPYV